jgi:hypothetical protein
MTPPGHGPGGAAASRPGLAYAILVSILDLQPSSPPVRPRADETASRPPPSTRSWGEERRCPAQASRLSGAMLTRAGLGAGRRVHPPPALVLRRATV